MKPIQPLHLRNQQNSYDKQNCFIYTHTQNLHSLQNYRQLSDNLNLNQTHNIINHHSHSHSQSQSQRKQKYHTTRNGLSTFKQNQQNKRIKTTTNDNNIYESKDNRGQQFIKTFYNTSQQFIKTHKPFLQNKRIVFNLKGRNRSNFLNRDIKNIDVNMNMNINGNEINNLDIDLSNTNTNTNTQQKTKKILKQSNIQKLKKQIIQLDKQDFVSYRSKGYTQTDQIKIIQNQKINKYNYQNSMIVQWKGKYYQKPFIVRPNSTIGVSNLINGNGNGNFNINTPNNCNNFMGTVSHSSMAKKYFSKPKNKRNYTYSNTTQICGSNININVNMQSKQNYRNKSKIKTQQIAIGLNMFRGKLHRKKVNSSFQIHY